MSERQRRIALTGGIASGKSTVADMFADLGAVLIDSDKLAREVVEPGTEGLRRIRERFGDDVVTADGALDRPALGRIVFADDAARADLNAIVHPRVRQRAEELERDAPADRLVLQVIPLLVEASLVEGFDEVIVVDLLEEEQLRRLTARDGFTPQEAQARLDAQASRVQRLAVATHVVDNGGSLEETAAQVQRIYDRLT